MYIKFDNKFLILYIRFLKIKGDKESMKKNHYFSVLIFRVFWDLGIKILEEE